MASEQGEHEAAWKKQFLQVCSSKGFFPLVGDVKHIDTNFIETNIDCLAAVIGIDGKLPRLLLSRMLAPAKPHGARFAHCCFVACASSTCAI